MILVSVHSVACSQAVAETQNSETLGKCDIHRARVTYCLLVSMAGKRLPPWEVIPLGE